MAKYRALPRKTSSIKLYHWIIALGAALLISKFVSADNIYNGNFPANTPYIVCFTPGGDCTGVIVNNINQAHKTIYVQAYSFTSSPIANALSNAAKRGVDVKVILDKSQNSNRYTIVKYLRNSRIPTWIDYQPAIAHNKVMIIDGYTLITGSFNFTNAAQQNNAENLLVIKDPDLAAKYFLNWQNRQAVSEKLS